MRRTEKRRKKKKRVFSALSGLGEPLTVDGSTPYGVYVILLSDDVAWRLALFLSQGFGNLQRVYTHTHAARSTVRTDARTSKYIYTWIDG